MLLLLQALYLLVKLRLRQSVETRGDLGILYFLLFRNYLDRVAQPVEKVLEIFLFYVLAETVLLCVVQARLRHQLLQIHRLGWA